MSALAAASGTKYSFCWPFSSVTGRPLIRSGWVSNAAPSGSPTASRCRALRMRYSACTEMILAGVTTIRTTARSMLVRLTSSNW